MLFLKSLCGSLKQSHHKIAVLFNLGLVQLLAIHGERDGNRDRRVIQYNLHQSE